MDNKIIAILSITAICISVISIGVSVVSFTNNGSDNESYSTDHQTLNYTVAKSTSDSLRYVVTITGSTEIAGKTAEVTLEDDSLAYYTVTLTSSGAFTVTTKQFSKMPVSIAIDGYKCVLSE